MASLAIVEHLSILKDRLPNLLVAGPGLSISAFSLQVSKEALSNWKIARGSSSACFEEKRSLEYIPGKKSNR